MKTILIKTSFLNKMDKKIQKFNNTFYRHSCGETILIKYWWKCKMVQPLLRRRQWQPTPVFLPGESQGQRSLVGCHPWGRTELDMTEASQQQQQRQQQQQQQCPLIHKCFNLDEVQLIYFYCYLYFWYYFKEIFAKCNIVKFFSCIFFYDLHSFINSS